MKAGSVSKMGVLVSSLAALALTPVVTQAVETITAWDLQTTTGAVKILGDAAARFEKANPGFKVEQSHIQNDAYKTKLKALRGIPAHRLAVVVPQNVVGEAPPA